MESLLDWGIEVVLWFQQFSPTLDFPFKAVTFLGDKEFFLLLMPLVYWCINRQAGAKLFMLLLFSAYLNEVAKLLADQPRPFNYDPRVIKIVHADSGGFPSGHTQSAVVVWGYLACRFNKKALWVFAGFLILAIPLSRIYLGAHFPTDLLGGYVIGALVLFLFIWLTPRIESWFLNKGIIYQLEPADVYRVIRYVLVGLWGGLGAPWLFVRLRLAEKEPFENTDLGMRNAEL